MRVNAWTTTTSMNKRPSTKAWLLLRISFSFPLYRGMYQFYYQHKILMIYWKKKLEKNSILWLTCRWNASGMVKVLEIQQNVFTTCVGTPLTMHDMGLPTYCVAVMIRLQAINSAVVNRLCNRKIALSVSTSCNLKYSLSPPSNLYMIV